jgi:hypothetical protein
MKTEIMNLAVNNLTGDTTWKEIVAIAREILQETERQALECEDEKETVRLMGECRGAKRFLSQWLNAIEQMKQGESKDSHVHEVSATPTKEN